MMKNTIFFRHKFRLSGFEFQGEFIRKLMLYGLVIRLDKKKYEKVIWDISGVAANVNQILFHHFIQRFSPSEITRENALQVGIELCLEFLGNEHQYYLTVATKYYYFIAKRDKVFKYTKWVKNILINSIWNVKVRKAIRGHIHNRKRKILSNEKGDIYE